MLYAANRYVITLGGMKDGHFQDIYEYWISNRESNDGFIVGNNENLNPDFLNGDSSGQMVLLVEMVISLSIVRSKTFKKAKG